MLEPLTHAWYSRSHACVRRAQGLGKTVQVMALIAHLMEQKGNYGPHLIIVPNAVMVNWKSELQRWLPGVRCIYYVGTREVPALPGPALPPPLLPTLHPCVQLLFASSGHAD